jgi:NADH-quinone oxidoreductase subunit H
MHALFGWLNDKWTALIEWLGLPDFIVPVGQMVFDGICVAGFIAVLVLFLIWLERKISGHAQDRFGPMRVGWHGCIQTVADAIKLIQKEDIVPARADRWVYNVAPFVAFAPTVIAFVVIPFGDGVIVKDLNIGILFLFAITSFAVIAIVMGGWASNNKYALLGAFRSAAQLVSYEVPLVLSVLGVLMLAGTMRMGGIVEAQSSIWFIVYQPLGFLIYFIAATAEVNRTPFDIPEAEQELVAGFNVEYSGMKFAMFFLAEFANMFLVSAIATTLFLGGWKGPFQPYIPGEIWFLIKALALTALIQVFRWTYPRLRVDQLMSFAWKLLLPLAFLNIIVTGLILVLR